MTPALTITIPGKPVPKGRPRVINGRAHTPPETRAYERHAKACVQAHMLAQRATPIAGDVAVRLLIVFPTRVHGDLDNVCKAVLDAAQGVAFGDDKSVAKLEVERVYDKASPRVELTVRQHVPRDFRRTQWAEPPKGEA